MTLFFFNDLATPALYTLSLHDALPICTRFTTDGRVSSDDGLEREDQLDKGMVLKVRGSWDGRGEGRADNISYDDTLRGPLTGATWDASASTGELNLLGQSIALAKETVFRGATPEQLAANP